MGHETMDDEEVLYGDGVVMHEFCIKDAAFREGFEFLDHSGWWFIFEPAAGSIPEGEVVGIDLGVIPVPFLFPDVLTCCFQAVEVVRFRLEGVVGIWGDQCRPIWVEE